MLALIFLIAGIPAISAPYCLPIFKEGKMAQKFKIKLKVTGFELEVEGSRDDVPLMAQAVGQQMSGLLIPAASIVEGEIVEDKNSSPPSIESQLKPRKKKSPRQHSTTSSVQASNGKSGAIAVDWRHDPSKWGTPQQEWSTANKSIWLLYVVSKEASLTELNGSEIAETFNKHFRQSGAIRTGQVNRDLGQSKGAKGKPAMIAENTTKRPSGWYLTQEGEKFAQELVTKALGRN
jgi:hypothetical protein